MLTFASISHIVTPCEGTGVTNIFFPENIVDQGTLLLLRGVQNLMSKKEDHPMYVDT